MRSDADEKKAMVEAIVAEAKECILRDDTNALRDLLSVQINRPETSVVASKPEVIRAKLPQRLRRLAAIRNPNIVGVIPGAIPVAQPERMISLSTEPLLNLKIFGIELLDYAIKYEKIHSIELLIEYIQSDSIKEKEEKNLDNLEQPWRKVKKGAKTYSIFPLSMETFQELMNVKVEKQIVNSRLFTFQLCIFRNIQDVKDTLFKNIEHLDVIKDRLSYPNPAVLMPILEKVIENNWNNDDTFMIYFVNILPTLFPDSTSELTNVLRMCLKKMIETNKTQCFTDLAKLPLAKKIIDKDIDIRNKIATSSNIDFKNWYAQNYKPSLENIIACSYQFHHTNEYLLEQAHCLKNKFANGLIFYDFFSKRIEKIVETVEEIMESHDTSINRFIKIVQTLISARNSILTNSPNSSIKCSLMAEIDNILETAIEKVKDFNLVSIVENKKVPDNKQLTCEYSIDFYYNAVMQHFNNNPSYKKTM